MSDYAENAIDATIAHQPSPGERFYPAFEVTPELDAAASESVFNILCRSAAVKKAGEGKPSRLFR